MGREPFRRLRRAGGHTPTLELCDDEGGSGPAGASSSTAFRLDPADNEANQMTAPFGANINNLDAVSLADTSMGAMASPTASYATQEPVWPPAAGGMTSLDAYLAATHLVNTAQVMGDSAAGAGGTTSSSPPTAGPPTSFAAASTTTGAAPPMQAHEGPPTPGATRSGANKIAPQRADPESTLPTATGATTTVRQVAGQFGTALAHASPDRKQTPPPF